MDSAGSPQAGSGQASSGSGLAMTVNNEIDFVIEAILPYIYQIFLDHLLS